MSPYIEKLKNEWEKKGTILCFGMDPVVERMGIDASKNLGDEIVTYFSRILHEIKAKIAAVKPNVAFYLQYGNEGLTALMKLINIARSSGLPIIIDAKMGDIGNTSKAYAKYIFEVLKGDAVTLNPYIGYDGLEPFFSYKDRGFYVLALTSNRGAGDFQYSCLDTDIPLYEKVLMTLCTWKRKHDSVGAVIGATHEEFKSCVKKIMDRKCSFPLLVPGVGAQGGSYIKIKSILSDSQYDMGIVRINASSSISYAHEKYSEPTLEESSFKAVEELMNS